MVVGFEKERSLDKTKDSEGRGYNVAIDKLPSRPWAYDAEDSAQENTTDRVDGLVPETTPVAFSEWC